MILDLIETLGLDLNYLQWLYNLLYPIAITFILPFTILILLYVCAFILQLFYLRGYLLNINYTNTQTLIKKVISAIWTAHGRIWHGHEVKGIENIPVSGPVMIIYYHGALPTDFYYLVSSIYTTLNRSVYCIGDRILFKVPGFKWLLKELKVLPGTVSTCVELLSQGNIVGISPGGVREALFSSEYYELLWGQRRGFARVVKQAGVPVIPVFTKNIRESFRTIGVCQGFFRSIYEKYRLPLIPIYGGFPVKLTTIIGEAMTFDTTATEEEIAEEIKRALELLISQHQQIPGNILRSLRERFY